MAKILTDKRRVAAAAAAVLLTLGAAAGTLAHIKAGGPDHGEGIGSTAFVTEVVENIGLERQVVRDAIDRAKADADSGSAGSKSFEALLAENLDMETLEVEDALIRARLSVLNERMDGMPAAVLKEAGTN